MMKLLQESTSLSSTSEYEKNDEQIEVFELIRSMKSMMSSVGSLTHNDLTAFAIKLKKSKIEQYATYWEKTKRMDENFEFRKS